MSCKFVKYVRENNRGRIIQFYLIHQVLNSNSFFVWYLCIDFHTVTAQCVIRSFQKFCLIELLIGLETYYDLLC